MTESRDDKLESEYEHERGFDAAGWLVAQVDLECDVCGLNIHTGDPIVLGPNSWIHPLCDADYALSVAAEERHDRDRESGR